MPVKTLGISTMRPRVTAALPSRCTCSGGSSSRKRLGMEEDQLP